MGKRGSRWWADRRILREALGVLLVERKDCDFVVANRDDFETPRYFYHPTENRSTAEALKIATAEFLTRIERKRDSQSRGGTVAKKSEDDGTAIVAFVVVACVTALVVVVVSIADCAADRLHAVPMSEDIEQIEE